MTVKQAERNLRLALLLRVFAKRVFLPLYAVYFTQVAGFSLKELGLLGAVFSLVGLISEVPTGYFADRFGRVRSIRVSGILNVIATLLYVFAQHKLGIFIGTCIEAVGYAFFAGAVEALVHDSLVVLGKEKQYTKVSSRIQSRSLLINAGIIALVPMTYAIDPRAPFLIGTIAYCALFVTSLYLKDSQKVAEAHPIRLLTISKLKNYRSFIAFAFIFGAFGALYTGPSDMQTLAFNEYGLNPELIGWLFAAASILGAIIGVFIHYLKKLSILQYAALDVFIVSIAFATYGTGNLIASSVAFLCGMSFWRYRKIIYQDHLLDRYKTRYKATLLSVMNNAEQLHAIWVPILAGGLVYKFGFLVAFRVLSGVAIVVGGIFIISTYSFLSKRIKIYQ